MGWLGKRKKPSHEEEEEEERRRQEAEAKAARSAKAGPPLVLLVPDVAGVSSYRMHHLPDAPAGAEFIQSTLSWQKKSGIHAFWGLQDEPEATSESEPERGDEAMVLIRTADGSDLVYVVSFIDIESAQSFARFEVKRGLGLGLILIYWACAVTVTETEDGVRLNPEIPPRGEKRPGSRPAKASAAVPVADEERSQHEEKRKAQAELAEMQRRAAMAEQRRRQLEEKKRLQTELAEMQQHQAEEEEARKRQIQADRAARRAAAQESDRRFQETEEETKRLKVEAEEIAQLKVQTGALRRQQAETREIARLKQEAEALRKQLAEAEHNRREVGQRQAEAEEMGPRETEAEEQRRQTEVEERRRLQEELADVQRRQAEAEERHRQAEAQETPTREALEERGQQAEVEQPLALAGRAGADGLLPMAEQTETDQPLPVAEEAGADQQLPLAERAGVDEPLPVAQPGADQLLQVEEQEGPDQPFPVAEQEPLPELEGIVGDSVDRAPVLETIAETEDAIEDWPPRMPSNGSGPVVSETVTPIPLAADNHGMPESLPNKVLVDAVEPTQAVPTGDGDPAAPDEFVAPAIAVNDQGALPRFEGPPPQETDTEEESLEQVIARVASRFEEAAEDMDDEAPVTEVTEAIDSLQESDQAFAAELEVFEEEPSAVPAAVAELPAEIPPEFAREAVAASVTAETASEGALDVGDAEDPIPAEVSKLMGKQRWEKRDSPFKGFDSPPGRF